MDKKKIYICGINQESNSFNPTFSTLKIFSIKEKDEIAMDANNAQVQGVLKGIQEEDMTPIYGVYFRATPGATLLDEVLETFLNKLEADLKTVGEIDGVAIVFHGATVSQTHEDVCGDVSEFIRKIVGENVPITASFDLHANITEKIARNIDFICGFQKYPHLDILETGYRSIKMLAEYFKDYAVKTYKTSVPVIAPASGYTTETRALKTLMDKGREYVKQGKILDFSIRILV